MVRLQTLDLRIGVRVPASQPTQVDILRKNFDRKTMRTLTPSSLEARTTQRPATLFSHRWMRPALCAFLEARTTQRPALCAFLEARTTQRPALCAFLEARTTQRPATLFSHRWMRPALCAALLLVSGLLGLAQDSTEYFDKAPAPIDEALRARIDQYYHAFMAGKYKDAYVLVADESQDAFLEADKEQYRGCETIKIRYSDNFTKASVVESCQGEWKWHGVITPTTFAIPSSWKIVDGKWFWLYVRPVKAPFPFSPTGFITVPPAEAEAAKDATAASIVPKDLRATAQGILSKVTVDKQTVYIPPDESSHDVIRVHNAMPGVIKLQMDQLAVPGLKITVGKTDLAANEETTVSFDYRLDDPGIACVDCAKKLRGTSVVALHVIPTGQVFSINVVFGPPVQVHQSPAQK
jgi:hypothetical protein